MTIETTTSLEDLQEMRNQAATTIGELRDKFNARKTETEPGSWEGEERATWETVNEDFNKIDARMKTLRDSNAINTRWEQISELEKKVSTDTRDINKPTTADKITPEIRALAFQGWCASQVSDAEVGRRQADAMKQVGLSSNKKGLDIPLLNTTAWRQLQSEARSVHPSMVRTQLEKRDMTLATTAGGDFVPEGFVRDLEVSMLAYMGTTQAGSVIRTAGGGDLPWPTMNDTGNKGELLAINVAAAEQDPTTGVTTFNAYKMSSKVIIVPYELLEDADLSAELPNILNAAIAERIGRIREQYQTTGTGSGQPAGVVTGSSVGVTAASATAVTSGEIVELLHSVDPSYRTNASWMMHDGIILAIRLLQDANGTFIWQPGLQLGVPDQLLGHRIYTNQEMQATLATGTKTMLFGDFSKFKIREVNNIRLYRLVERYRDQDQDAFVAFQRMDSKILDAGTDPIKHLIMA